MDFRDRRAELIQIRMYSSISLISDILLWYLVDIYSIGKIDYSFRIFMFLIITEFAKRRLMNKFADKTISQYLHRLPNNPPLKDLTQCVILFGITTCVAHFILIIYGASIFDQVEETAVLAVLLTVLTTGCLCISLGHKACVQIVKSQLFRFEKPKVVNQWFSEVLLWNTRFTILGCWIGAFVIPLDWTRNWQAWPIPCYVGTLAGNLVGNIFALVVSGIPKLYFVTDNLKILE